MRIFIYAALSLTLAAGAFAQDAPRKKASARDEKAAAKGTLSTPFGVAKTTEQPTPKPTPKRTVQDWKVEKDGKGFKFTKKTPFGPSSWTRTEAELSDDERAVVERGGLLKPVEEPAEEQAETVAEQL